MCVRARIHCHNREGHVCAHHSANDATATRLRKTAVLPGCGSTSERPRVASVLQGAASRYRLGAAGAAASDRCSQCAVGGARAGIACSGFGAAARRAAAGTDLRRAGASSSLPDAEQPAALCVPADRGDVHADADGRWGRVYTRRIGQPLGCATVARVPGGSRGYELTLLVGDVSTGRVLHRLRVARADDLPNAGDVPISPRADVAVVLRVVSAAVLQHGVQLFFIADDMVQALREAQRVALPGASVR